MYFTIAAPFHLRAQISTLAKFESNSSNLRSCRKWSSGAAKPEGTKNQAGSHSSLAVPGDVSSARDYSLRPYPTRPPKEAHPTTGSQPPHLHPVATLPELYATSPSSQLFYCLSHPKIQIRRSSGCQGVSVFFPEKNGSSSGIEYRG